MLDFSKKPVIGMIHLPPMDGVEGFIGFYNTLQCALSDLKALQDGGVDAVIVENEHDHPHTIFISGRQKKCMEEITKQVVLHSKIPVGVCVLRNDWKAALSIAKNSGAQFIRMDVFVDKVEMQGEVVQVNPEEVLQYRKSINGEQIQILTDIQVKHSKQLENKTLVESAKEAIQKGSDAIVVTGIATGTEVELKKLREVKEAIKEFPLLIGSGFSENCTDYLKYCSGTIVGTSLKEKERISKQKTLSLMAKVNKIRGEKE